MNNWIKKNVVGLLVKASYREAEKNANSTCAFIHGQPQLPETVKNLNKFK